MTDIHDYNEYYLLGAILVLIFCTCCLVFTAIYGDLNRRLGGNTYTVLNLDPNSALYANREQNLSRKV